MTAAVVALSISGLSLSAQVKPAVLAGEPEEAKRTREELRVSLEHVAPSLGKHFSQGSPLDQRGLATSGTRASTTRPSVSSLT
jgi:hypothetical protein